MKKTLTLAFALALALALAVSGFAQEPVLCFSESADFKIAQFTDIHLKATAAKEAAKTFARMDNIVATEHPDLITITGDVVVARENARQMWTEVISRLDSYRIPWCVVYGNHDAEQDIPRPEMSAMIAARKYSINTLNPQGELADIRVPVLSSLTSNLSTLTLYFLDSHDYSTDPRIDGYGWLTREQIEWYRDAAKHDHDNSSDNAFSLAFFHIPLPEYREAWTKADSHHHDWKKGIRGEDECSPQINTGMFSAMEESKTMLGVFCGHDHDNDYLVSHCGIALAYGRYSGDNTVYNHLRHGVRIISVHEGERAFTTWIHEDDGTLQYKLRYKDGKIEE